MTSKGVFLLLLLRLCSISEAKPVLRIYVKGVQINNAQNKIKAEVKMGTKFYSILERKNGIALHEDVILQDISLFRFIVNRDTLIFYSANLLAHLKNVPGANKIDEMYSIFNELDHWDLYIDNFAEFSKKVLMKKPDNNSGRSTALNPKVYAWRTHRLFYYAPLKNGSSQLFYSV